MPYKGKYSKWKEYSKCEIYLSVLVSLLLVLSIYLIASGNNSFFYFSKNACISESCIRASARISKMLDKSVNPCDNFYHFVCGKFIKNTIIPEERISSNAIFLAGNDVKFQIKNLLEEPQQMDDSTPLKLLKIYYKSCMNTTLTEKNALTFIKKVFKEMGGWPLIESNWNEKKFDWKQLLYRLRRGGWHHDIFIKMYIDIDMQNTSRRILTITQPQVFAYDILKKGLNDSDTQAYYDYMINAGLTFGAPELSAAVEMLEVLKFEWNLSKIIIPSDGRQNLSLEYNPMTIQELQEKFPSISWLQFINNFLAPVDLYKLTDIINVAFPKYFEDLEILLFHAKKRILANYMFWHIVKNSVNHLPLNIRNEALEFYKKTKGITRAEPRWIQCLKETEKLHLAISYVYVKAFNANRYKEKVSEIASYIKEAFTETLLEKTWMDVETKERALMKLQNMGLVVGYPEEFLDKDNIEEYYRGLQLNSGDLSLKMKFNISFFLRKKAIKGLKEIVNHPDWTTHPHSFDIKGLYNQKGNFVELSAALTVQDHFFYPDRPQYLNFGSIGRIIGHEITHGYDYEGKQFNENGNLEDWWSSSTLQAFINRSKCFIHQYGIMAVSETENKTYYTLNENIADNGGIQTSYKAYLKWIKRNGEEKLLPSISYTPQQLFWISAASMECATYRNEALKFLFSMGQHSLEYFRIMLPFMNSENFAKDFECPEGSLMNPMKKCKIW